MAIKALYNESLNETKFNIPELPLDFVVDGGFQQKTIKIDEYKLPKPITMRVWTEGYLIDEFIEAIHDTEGEFVPKEKRELSPFPASYT